MNIATEWLLLLVMIASIGAWLFVGPCLWFLWFVRRTIRFKRAGWRRIRERALRLEAQAAQTMHAHS